MGWALDLWRSNALLALGIVLFLGGLGIPGPATIAIVATGALVRYGRISPVTALLVGLGCEAVGDLISYGIARRGLGEWLERRKRKPKWQKAVSRFERNALLALFLARWLFTPISLPLTYIAGSSRYPIARFLSASLLGQVVWIALYGAIGYSLGNRWESIGKGLREYGWWIGGAIVFVGVSVLVWRHKKAPSSEEKTGP